MSADMIANIGQLASALAKAQGKMKGATKDSSNPFFKSKYADLASVWEACREALSENELSVCQVPDMLAGRLVVRTILMHSSGETIVSVLPIMVDENATAQQIGSGITYARRYALAAMVGVAPEDDDGNSASQAPARSAVKKWASSKPGEIEKLKTDITELVKQVENCESLKGIQDLEASHSSLIVRAYDLIPEWASRLNDKIAQCKEAFELAE